MHQEGDAADVAAHTINIASLCTGGYGLDLGIELALPSARSIVLVEREAFAVAQLVSAMEAGLVHPAPVWSDVRTFDGRPWRGIVDGLIGGIPCQPHSMAGRKGGQNDPRDLWSSARRIVATARPWFVLIENVAGMLSAGDDEIAGAERVWRDLRKLGYAVEGGLFTAAEVGASHERERIFILGVADHEGEFWGDWATTRASGRPAGTAGGRGVGLADTDRERLEGEWPDAGTLGREDARRSAGLRDGATVEHAPGLGWREGRAEPELWSGRGASSSADGSVANTSIARSGRLPIQSRGQVEAHPNSDGAGEPLVDAIGRGRDGRKDDEIGQQERRGTAERSIELPLFAPGPDDIRRWARILQRAPELEPAFRRVADGLASRLDIARVDRLRLLGNGVVPLQAAYAFRTLVSRLTARGSARAAFLAGLMD